MVLGKDLKIGDVVKTWWQPGHDTIINIMPYHGVYENTICKNSTIAGFTHVRGMTIFADDYYEVVDIMNNLQ